MAQDPFRNILFAGNTELLRGQNRLDLGYGLLDRIVDDGVIVILHAADLFLRRPQALLDYRLGFGAAAPQALFKHLERRRQNEQADAVRRGGLDLPPCTSISSTTSCPASSQAWIGAFGVP